MNKNLPCFDCGKPAKWLFMPSSDMPEEQRWACEDHVPRGCVCNESPIDEDYDNLDPLNWKEDVDELGRKLPCCEWWYLDS